MNKQQIESRTAKSGFKKLAVQWLNLVQLFNQTFVAGDSFVLQNCELLKPANHWPHLYMDKNKFVFRVFKRDFLHEYTFYNRFLFLTIASDHSNAIQTGTIISQAGMISLPLAIYFGVKELW